MRAAGIASIEPRAELAEQYTRDVDAAHARMIWTHPGMTNWYRNAAGRVVATLPWRIVDYRAMLEASELSDYLTRERARRYHDRLTAVRSCRAQGRRFVHSTGDRRRGQRCGR